MISCASSSGCWSRENGWASTTSVRSARFRFATSRIWWRPRPHEPPACAAELLYSPESRLVQLSLIVDPAVLFPPHYAYTCGTTKIMRDNFAELYDEVMRLYPSAKEDLAVDVGSNDGTLL